MTILDSDPDKLAEKLLNNDLATVILDNAKQEPFRTAIICDGVQYTYKDLGERIRSIAGMIPLKGDHTDTQIGVMLNRGFDLVAALLAVNYTGAAYVPLDPFFPTERLQYIIDDAKINCILHDNQIEHHSFSKDFNRINLTKDVTNHELETSSSCKTDLAYSIYTSGSTGNPKGVLVPKTAMHNFLVSMASKPGINRDDVLLAVTTPSFDIAVLELFLPLLVGGTILIATESQKKSGAALVQLIASNHVTVMQATPVTWQMMLDAGWTEETRLKCLCGGEALTVGLAKALSSRTSELWNMYGPTETTVWSSCKQIDNISSEPLSVGSPIKNTYFVIMDEDGMAVQPGTTGELFIGGVGLARGYTCSQLTTDKFILDKSENQIGDGRLYRTGDRAYIEENELFIIGRTDSQIKIHGFRVEPAEIEAKINENVNIHSSVVLLLKSYGGSPLLCAALRGHDGSDLDVSDLVTFLKDKLPQYMVPEHFVIVSEFPKTPNQKIDRKAIQTELETSLNDEEISTPDGASDQDIAFSLLKSATGATSLGLHENLFEVGLTSVKANWVAARMTSITGRRFSVTDLFESPTIHGFLNGQKREAVSHRSSSSVVAKFSDASSNDIAIIGMSGRFPGADNIEELWDLIASGREGITHFSAEEDDPVAQALWGDNPNYKRVRGMIKNPELFDANLFGINPNDAAAMDPQQRIFLELAWEAFEHSGYGERYNDAIIGSFAGMGNNFYYHYNVSTHPDHIEMIGGVQTEIGREKDHIATLISYKFNLTGPSLSIHTACSTALVAIDSACQAILSNQCDMAIAGGIELRTPQFSGQVHEPGGIFTGDGHCRPFSDKASGTMFSDSAGVLILKRLKDAERDGDTIHAVIKGSATNHDGNHKKSYLAPSVNGQFDVISTALKRAKVSADSISYIEAHGTGTLVGDPIEFEALRRVFEDANAEKQSCAIGSIKANLGHPTTAAGVVGVIKCVLCMKHKTLPPLANFIGINPNIDIDNSPFFIPQNQQVWSDKKGPLRAGVSSFGFCGTNSHVVLEHYPDKNDEVGESVETRDFPLIISAQTNNAASELATKLADYVENSSVDLANASFTLGYGRKRLKRGLVVSARRKNKKVTLSKPMPMTTVETSGPADFGGKIGFLFPGQGSQYIGMGQKLSETEPVFKATFDECVGMMSEEMGVDLKSVMFGLAKCDPTGPKAIDNTFYTQPAIYCLEYSLAQLWQSWGVNPDFIIGHSIGEFVGATISGVFSLEDGVKSIAARGRLVSELPYGCMLSVRLPEDKILPLLPKEISLAAINSTNLCVVAGSDKDIAKLSNRLDEEDIHNKKLHTSHAFHSWMMDEAVLPFRQALDGIVLHTPGIPIVSSVTGTVMTDETAQNHDYWAEHLRRPVKFANAVKDVCDREESALFVEIGPRNTLSSLTSQIVPNKEQYGIITSLGGPDSSLDEPQSMACAYGNIMSVIPSIVDKGFFKETQRKRVPMPTYAFQRKAHWLSPTWLPGQQDKRIELLTEEHTPEIANESGNATEQVLIGILEEISGLDLSDIDYDTNFFELGLDSLLLTPLTFKLRKVFGLTVSFKQLVSEYNTPNLLVSKIESSLPDDHGVDDNRNKEASSPIDTEPQWYPLTPQQEMHVPISGIGEYSATVVFDDSLNLERLRGALLSLLMDNDALLLAFDNTNNLQRFEQTGSLDFQIILGSKEINTDIHYNEQSTADFLSANLKCLYEECVNGKSKIKLSVPSHVCDIWSVDILLESLARAYRNGTATSTEDKSKAYVDEVECFAKHMSDLKPYDTVNHKSPKSKPALTHETIEDEEQRCYQRIIIEENNFYALKQYASDNNESLFTAFVQLISQSFYQHEPSIKHMFAVTMAGQPFTDRTELVGQLANIVPLILDPQTASLSQVGEHLRELYGEQLNMHSFWSANDPFSMTGALKRLTHVQRLSSKQLDFGVSVEDYWFDLLPDSKFGNHIICTEYNDKMKIDFCSFDRSYDMETISTILSDISGDKLFARKIEKVSENA